eukprot:1174121-Rhodomonas_salina.2
MIFLDQKWGVHRLNSEKSGPGMWHIRHMFLGQRGIQNPFFFVRKVCVKKQQRLIDDELLGTRGRRHRAATNERHIGKSSSNDSR